MIPFLLSSRPAAGAPPPGTTLIDPATYSGKLNYAQRYSVSGPGTATASMIMRADGSWSLQRTPGLPTEGFWLTDPVPGAGAGFEVRFTVTGSFGVPTSLVNQASDWTAVSVDRSIQLTLTRNTTGADSTYVDVLVELRPIGGSAIGGSIRLECYVEIG